MRGGLAAATPAAVIVAATLPEQRVVISRLDRLAAEVRKHRLQHARVSS